MKSILKLENMDFSYSKNNILETVSFAIDEGDFVALTGANGSGKSTLLKVILGFEKAQTGTVTLLDEPIDAFSQFDDIGYVPQGGLLGVADFPATSLEIVMLRLSKGSFLNFYNKSRKKCALEALERVGMEAYASEMINNLSGGQLQRVLIARELIVEPKVLFLDEPTNGLDQEAIRNLYQLLEKLNQDQKMTIVMVTHNLDHDVQKINRIFEVKDRKVQEVKTHV
ncbi:metal ABC transporter ATP-binding protein [Erysipelothrix rhusiopathiae]|uniref:metal ABC transporter ATP-binding protein n=1 Tax=Erysipelothrix rhusiopathiae TaxID=1648 RepID=UPI000F42EB50|nr:metal ABC transporter ATP-binding protein [Erysipelothrix rhusiopathiae]AYV34545.1 metal ABC transporter ATP-binding protein [Erysipelothrix rhusiopathiae]MDE8314430.1 metal ABC transporter ATP-binding protein [Erysipelothrix rhusiopathiae]